MSEELNKLTQAILDALEGFEAVATKLKMDLGKNPTQKFVGADDLAQKLIWYTVNPADASKKPYERSDSQGPETEKLKALIKSGGGQIFSKTATYRELMAMDGVKVARRKK